MTEQPNDPGRAGPEGAVPPFAVVPLVVAPAQPPAESAEAGEKYTAGFGFGLWCCALFGACGIHRFYLGMYGTGILWLLTLGLFGVGQFLDLFRMKGLVQTANIRDGYLPHPRRAHRLQGPSDPPRARRKLTPAENTQQVLLKAAQANGGALTVTQGVLASGLSFDEVEESLREMVVRGHVDVDNVADSGVIVYRFPGLAGPLT
ncbi:NINE protein [Candidatus Palauibacter sp.]|uniref:NINE protein n=1 Tax=Candidatus Palauibacter sp. TaxID=3101350 RepID=UPI003AF27126